MASVVIRLGSLPVYKKRRVLTGTIIKDKVVLDQQYVEVINKGNPALIKVQSNQQYVEVINKGDPALIKVQLNQQYIELICTFGTPPVQTNSGKKDKPPGKNKAAALLTPDARWRHMQKMDRKRQTRRFMSVTALLLRPTVFVPTPQPRPKRRFIKQVITSGPDGHVVRNREASYAP